MRFEQSPVCILSDAAAARVGVALSNRLTMGDHPACYPFHGQIATRGHVVEGVVRHSRTLGQRRKDGMHLVAQCFDALPTPALAFLLDDCGSRKCFLFLAVRHAARCEVVN